MTFPIPRATRIVTLTAVGVGLVSNLLTRRFVDLNAERRIKAEVSAFNAELKAAVRDKDKEKEQRLKKKEQQMAQMKLKMSSARTKISIGTMMRYRGAYDCRATRLGALRGTVRLALVPI